jgi:hypothetical protein
VELVQTAKRSTPRSLLLSVIPGVELSEVYVSVAPVDRDGRIGHMIQDGKALGYGYYPPGQPVAALIPAPVAKGLFYVEIAASMKAGGSVTLPVWFINFR